MIAIVDYGAGNIFSVKNALDFLGLESQLTDDAAAIQAADAIILPGVGAFPSAMQMLKERNLVSVLQTESKKKPFLGICLGMQLLLDRSFEFGEHPGLGLISGDICPISTAIPAGLKIPHMGWNSLTVPGEKHPLFRYIHEGDCVYFVHSFYATDCTDAVIATTEYGAELTAAVARGNVMGCQFHPEKSGDVGLAILKTFCEGSW